MRRFEPEFDRVEVRLMLVIGGIALIVIAMWLFPVAGSHP